MMVDTPTRTYKPLQGSPEVQFLAQPGKYSYYKYVHDQRSYLCTAYQYLHLPTGGLLGLTHPLLHGSKPCREC